MSDFKREAKLVRAAASTADEKLVTSPQINVFLFFSSSFYRVNISLYVDQGPFFTEICFFFFSRGVSERERVQNKDRHFDILPC